MTTWFAEHALILGSWGVLAVVLLLPALEAAVPLIGILIPGQSVVVAGGVVAYHGQVPLPAAMAAALAGGLLGNTAGYLAGRRWEHRLLKRMPRRLAARHTTKALALVERHAGQAVLVGRFTAGLRTLVPMLCGISGIPLRRYLLWSALSCALWAPAFVLFGFAIGAGGPW